MTLLSLKMSFHQFSQRWLRRLWWFDVVYPITVALILFCSLTYIVYSGQRSSRLSLMAEQKLLEYSLSIGKGRTASPNAPVRIATATPFDVARYGKSTAANIPEIRSDAYAAVIRKLIQDGVKSIFVRWQPSAHPSDSDTYAPLLEAISSLPAGVRVHFVVPSSEQEDLPTPFKNKASLLEDEPCNYPDRLTSDCPFNPDWPSWVIQAILNQALAHESTADASAQAHVEAPWITTQMPSIAPSYILNLPDPRSLRHETFTEVLTEQGAKTSTGSLASAKGDSATVAFVGPDLSSTLSRVDDGITRFLHTPYAPSQVDYSVIGTPIHVFWAMVSEMFHQREWVATPPEWACITFSALLCLGIIIVMSLFSGTLATGMFLLFIMTGPVANAAAIRWLNFYAPLFDSYYFGLSTFIVAGFGRLSFSAFRKWRLVEQRRILAHTADLKGNFISLLSHNLNTPVAKMQGMLALLLQNAGDQSWKTNVKSAEFHVTRLEYTIRSVLVASLVEEGSLSTTPRSLKAIMDEMQNVFATSLKRLGVQCTFEFDASDDLSQVPIATDLRAITTALAGVGALFAKEGEATSVSIRGKAIDDGENVAIEFHVHANRELPPQAAAVLNQPGPISMRTLGGTDFFVEVLAGLAILAARAYGGLQTLANTPTGTELCIRMGKRTGNL